MDRKSKAELVTRFLQALRFGQLDTLAQCLAEDAIWQIPKSSPPPFGGRHQGRDNILAILAESLPNMFLPDIGGIEIADLIIENDKAVAEVTISGQTAANRHYENQYVFIIKLIDNKILEFKEHLDTQHANDIFWS